MGDDLAIVEESEIHPPNHQNYTVHVGLLDNGMVYSPGRRRKKKAMTIRLVMAILMVVPF
jgi:hypothetical protein